MISVKITNPSISDIPSLKKLWKEIFKDSDNYINLFFEKKFSPETSFVIKENGEIKAMLFAEITSLSENGKSYSGVYLCGIATTPSARRKGYATMLIDYTIKKFEGIDVYYLIPASRSLFDYYKRFGFEPFTYFDKIEIKEKECTKVYEYSNEFSYPVMNDFYEKSCNGLFVKRNEKDFEAIYECYKKIMIFDDGYIVYQAEDGILTVTEYTVSFEKAKNIGSYLMKKGNLKKGFILKRDGTVPFSACITKMNFGKERYVNLMLN